MSQLFKNYGKYKEDKNNPGYPDPYYKYPSQKVIPDNTTPHLIMKPDYNEVIILGADNTHCFTIPYRKEQISDLKIVYNQGIETKLIKEYHVLYNENNEIEEETLDTQNIGLGASLKSTEASQSILDELNDLFIKETTETSPFIPSNIIHWDFPGNSKYWKSLISFDITAEETKNFNWYNQDVSVQIFIVIRNGHYKSQENFELDPNKSTQEYLEEFDKDFSDITDPLDYEFINEDDEFIVDTDIGPCNYDVSPIYKVKVVRKLKEGEVNNE